MMSLMEQGGWGRETVWETETLLVLPDTCEDCRHSSLDPKHRPRRGASHCPKSIRLRSTKLSSSLLPFVCFNNNLKAVLFLLTLIQTRCRWSALSLVPTDWLPRPITELEHFSMAEALVEKPLDALDDAVDVKEDVPAVEASDEHAQANGDVASAPRGRQNLYFVRVPRPQIDDAPVKELQTKLTATLAKLKEYNSKLSAKRVRINAVVAFKEHDRSAVSHLACGWAMHYPLKALLHAARICAHGHSKIAGDSRSQST